MRRVLLTLAAGAVLAAGATAQEAERPLELLVCAPGFPGTPTQAQSVVDALAARIAADAGWPAGRLRARYVASESEGVKALAPGGTRPALLLTTLAFYCKHHAAIGGELVAASALAGSPRQGFRVVVPPGFAGDGVAALAGKRLTGTRVEDPTFVRRLILGAGRDGAPAVTLVDGKRTLRAVKQAAGDDADALLVSDDEWRLLQTPELRDRVAGWRTLHHATDLPTAPVVALGASPATAPDPALAAAARRALTRLRSDAAGTALCERLRVSGFAAPDPAAYAAAIKRYHPPKHGTGGEGDGDGDRDGD